MSSEFMSVIEYAAHRGCSDSYIRRMRRQGKLVMHADGKQIQVAASDKLLDEITDPVRGGDRDAGAGNVPDAPMGAPEGSPIQDAVRRERLARARMAELELGEEAKELTRTKDVELVVVTLVRKALNGLLGMSGRLRAKLAAESDPYAIEEMLDKEIRRISDEMRKEAQLLLVESKDCLSQGAADIEANAA